MRRSHVRKQRRGGVWLWLLAILLSTGCTPSGSKPATTSTTFVVLDSEQVSLIDPNKPFIATRPSAVLDRGYYMKLESIYMKYVYGQLVEK